MNTMVQINHGVVKHRKGRYFLYSTFTEIDWVAEIPVIAGVPGFFYFKKH